MFHQAPRSTLLTTALLLLSPPAAGQALLIEDVTVIDGKSADPLAGQDVSVIGDRIVAIAGHGNVMAPADAVVVDGRGKFLMPGMWDMHVHPDDPEVWHVNPAKEEKEKFLPLFVVNGVTSVRDMGGDLELLLEWRRRITEGELLGPRFYLCGPLVDGPEPMWPGSVAVSNAEQGRQAVDDLLARGVDFIKVYSLLPSDGFHAIAARARERGVPFSGHVPNSITVADGSDAGMASQDHFLGVLREVSDQAAVRAAMTALPADATGTQRRNAWFRAVESHLDEGRLAELGERLAANDTWQVPTLILWKRRAWFDAGHPEVASRLPYMPQYIRDWWQPENNVHLRDLTEESMEGERIFYRLNLAVMRAFREAGVRFLPGTDTGGNPHLFPGFSVHDELEIFVEAGMTPMEAIVSATAEPARFTGRADRFGTIEAGKIADLVLLDADPTADIRNTRRIEAVIYGGRLMDRARLDAILAGLRG